MVVQWIRFMSHFCPSGRLGFISHPQRKMKSPVSAICWWNTGLWIQDLWPLGFRFVTLQLTYMVILTVPLVLIGTIT